MVNPRYGVTKMVAIEAKKSSNFCPSDGATQLLPLCLVSIYDDNVAPLSMDFLFVAVFFFFSQKKTDFDRLVGRPGLGICRKSRGMEEASLWLLKAQTDLVCSSFRGL